MIPLDVAEPAEIRARVRAYLGALGVDDATAERWVAQACEGASRGGAAFARLREILVADLATRAPGVVDDPECAAFARLSVWLGVDAATLARLPLAPALTRQSMTSERQDADA